jgi:type VII secretion protein EccB
MRAPATRDQVDAYRFGLRRLEAALVRGDPVPLHEQIRGQRRAAMAGALLGMLALGGVAIVALVSPAPDWRSKAVVVGRESGVMYVVAHGPDRLVPVANLPAARLMLAALRGGGASAADPGTAVPVVVPDTSLAGAPRTPAAAVAGADAVRLDAPGVPPRWAVCDEIRGDGRGPTATTVVAGAELPPPPAPSPDAVLLAVPDGRTWLVTGGRRHEVDLDDRPTAAVLGLAGREPRGANPDLVSALPVGPALTTPAVRARAAPAPPGVPGRVGDVLATGLGAGAQRFHVVLRSGVQEVPATVAEVLRAAGGAVQEVAPDVVARAAPTAELDVEAWPATVPRILGSAEAPYVCWTWAADADPAGGVLFAAALPVPARTATVALAQADGSGARADAVVLAEGGTVRATAPGRVPGTGPLWLVSATGVVHRVVDAPTAAALGISRAEPAPEAALRMLPTGPSLDLAETARLLDIPATQ